ncbi:MAG: hypothetical protein FGM45_11005 [Actinobacteria bacterium]|nr:hypothetical protein [Actinomycetota bacterium]
MGKCRSPAPDPPSHLGGIKSEVLLQRLSAERLSTYLAATHGDIDRAIRLYEWNAEVSAALFEVIGHVEVVLRNAIHEQMTAWCRANGHDENWFLNGHGFLDDRAVRDVAKALGRVRSSGRDTSPDRLVSTLSFGFWRFLLTNRYKTTLWPSSLRGAFPLLVKGTDAELFGAISRIHALRNRVAHHEPIFRRRLDFDLLDAYLVARAIDPAIETWIRERSRVEQLLETRP